MSTVEHHHSAVYRQLESYEQSWQRDHDAVKTCSICEDAIAVGLATYSLVVRVESAWRERVFRELEKPSDQASTFHRMLFDLWLRVTDEVLIWTGQMQQSYGTVAGAEELQQAACLIRERLAKWQAPRVSAAIGLREMTLSKESAADLEKVIQRAANDPLATSSRALETRTADFLLK